MARQTSSRNRMNIEIISMSCRYVEDERLPTGCCAAIVRPDGTRCLAADLGAARDFCSDHLDRIDGFTDLLDQTAVLYVEGFFASHSPDAALAALRHAHSHGGVVRILSLSAPYVCRQFYSEIRYDPSFFVFQ